MKKFTKRPIHCETEEKVRTYKDYSFYNKDGHKIIIDNKSGRRYTLREIQPDDICCIISTYDEGDLIYPIEDNMACVPHASNLGITDIIDYISSHLI